jgi:preprotein translocase subunit YajC
MAGACARVRAAIVTPHPLACPHSLAEVSVELLPLVALFAVFWFLLIRPQQKRRKEQQEMVASLQVGDDVVTIGGLHGRVVAVDEVSMDLEVTAESDVVLRFERTALGRIIRDAPTAEG